MQYVYVRKDIHKRATEINGRNCGQLVGSSRFGVILDQNKDVSFELVKNWQDQVELSPGGSQGADYVRKVSSHSGRKVVTVVRL